MHTRHTEVEGPTGGQHWGLLGRARPLFEIGSCIYFSAQFAVLVMLTARHNGPANGFEAIRLPVEYLCPLAVALGFRANVNRLERENLLQKDTANSIRDWMLALVIFMYGGIFDFWHVAGGTGLKN